MGINNEIRQEYVERARGEEHLSVPEKDTMRFIWTAIGDEPVKESVPFWCDYTGQLEDSVHGWGWMEALHPDDREHAMALWSQAVENKRAYEVRYRVRRRNGMYYTCKIKYVPVFHRNGVLNEWVSWFTDLAAVPEISASSSYTFEPYTLIFERAAMGMTCTSLDGRFLQVNEHFCTLLGYPREEVLGKSFQDFTHPEDYELGYTVINQMLRGTVPLHPFEKRYIRKDGRIIWVRLTTTLLRQPSGEPIFFLAFVEDITVQKHAEVERAQLLMLEQEARAAEQRAQQETLELANQLKAVFSSMTECVLVCDLHGKLLHINEAGRKMLEIGLDSDETLLEAIARYTIYDDHGKRLRLEEMPISRILRGETLPSSQPVDIVVEDGHGQQFYITSSGAPVCDQQGQPIGAVCVFHDVTPQRRKVKRLEHALKGLLTVVDALVRIPDGTTQNKQSMRSMSDVGRRLAELTQEVLEARHITLISIDPVSGKLDLVGAAGFTSEQVQQYHREMERAYLTGYFNEEEIERMAAGELLIRDLVARPFQHGSSFGRPKILLAPWFTNNQLTGTFSIDKPEVDGQYPAEDIALVKAIAQLTTLMIERVRILNEWAESQANERALQEANRRFDAFISLASHELKTPLTTIQGNVQLALRRLNTLKKQEGANSALSNIERITEPLEYAVQRVNVENRLINDLLDSSRIRSNKLEFVMRQGDLLAIVRQASADLQQSAPDRTIRLHLPDLPALPILADTDRIEQVVNNYVANAIKYSSADRPIDITLQVVDDTARVSVRDEGPGLTPEEQQQIWDRFYRVPGIQVQYGNGPGLGLGLYICRTIIERHHGQVGLDSSPGTGSTFWFTLPLASKQ